MCDGSDDDKPNSGQTTDGKRDQAQPIDLDAWRERKLERGIERRLAVLEHHVPRSQRFLSPQTLNEGRDFYLDLIRTFGRMLPSAIYPRKWGRRALHRHGVRFYRGVQFVGFVTADWPSTWSWQPADNGEALFLDARKWPRARLRTSVLEDPYAAFDYSLDVLTRIRVTVYQVRNTFGVRILDRATGKVIRTIPWRMLREGHRTYTVAETELMLLEAAESWLQERYPLWRDPAAYWDEADPF